MWLMRLIRFLTLFAITIAQRGSIIFERFENCPGYKNLTSLIKNTQIHVVKNKMLLNYETHVIKDSRGKLEYVWEIERCSNKENLDTCFKFSRIKTDKFCSILESKNDAWTPMLDCMHPKMTCPLKKGVYAGRNCTIDSTAFKLFPLQGAYWRFRVLLLERKLIRMCAVLLGYMKD